MNAKLLILERSGNTLSFKQDNAGAYVLEGVFGEIDKLNRNNRIYTEDEYLPQVEALQSKINSSKLLGELDHPQNFDISLKNVSHIIEELRYDKASKQILGKIRLLDTDAGRQAKALVDAGVPLHISSRAAGTVESNGKVKIKQLFTYDLVADPGFANAELKRVNEAFGFEEDSDLLIYEINPTIENTQTQIKESEKMEQSKFVSSEDFNNYSKYLAEEIKALKEAQAKANDSESLNAQVENLKEYASYLAEKVNQSIAYSEHVAEKADQGIQFADTLAEKLEQAIQYSEHIAEGTEQIKNYTNYLAESYNSGAATHENVVKYMEYLKENLQKVTEYAEYVAETVNSNLLMEADDVIGTQADDLDGKTKDVSGDIEFDDKAVDQSAHDDSKELEKDLEGEDEAAKEVAIDGEAADKVKNEAGEKAEEGEAGKEVVESVDRMEAYKNEISSKLSALLESASAKQVEEPHFFKFISEAKKEEFNTLTTEEKTAVAAAVTGKGFLTESQIYALWNSSLAGAVNTESNEPYVLTAMPKEYRETYNALSESKKGQLLAQSKYFRLETEYQVRNFWQTRDLREFAPVIERVEMIKESTEEVKQLPYNMEGVAEALNKKFKK
jgi:hypothetical protein